MTQLRPVRAKEQIKMSQSLNKIFIHLIFHIKTTSPPILDENIERVHAYIGQLINTTGCKVVRIGGVNDHVHVLFMLSRDTTISHVVEEVKRNSSRWIKTLSPHYAMFSWQGGYAAFSLGKSMVDTAINYIANQKEHHKKRAFAEEYKDFLDKYEIEYDDRYLFTD